MRPLGRFVELVGSNGDAGSLVEAMHERPIDYEYELVQYLRRGVFVVDVMERKHDVLDGSFVQETGSLLTDGAWFWREDLAHYVSKYHLALPADFLERAKTRSFQVPNLSRDDLVAATKDVIALWTLR